MNPWSNSATASDQRPGPRVFVNSDFAVVPTASGGVWTSTRTARHTTFGKNICRMFRLLQFLVEPKEYLNPLPYHKLHASFRASWGGRAVALRAH